MRWRVRRSLWVTKLKVNLAAVVWVSCMRREPALNRTVAVKTLMIAAPETCDRFRREAEAIARLDHPHIVPVYEVGEWFAGEGRAVPYFTMKWYPGGSLDSVPSAQARI